MASHHLAGCRVLIIEDEYYLADEANSILSDVGVQVLGPVATVDAACTAIEREPRIDGALLDINLRGEMAFDVADRLHARGIPFAFVTGYDREALPARFAAATSLAKPVGREQLIDLFGEMGLPRPR